MKKTISVLAGVAALCATTAQAVTVTAYTDRDAYLAALAGEDVQRENFNRATLANEGGNDYRAGALSFTFDGSPAQDISFYPRLEDGQLLLNVDEDGDPRPLTLSVDGSLRAFGARFESALSGSGLILEFGGQRFDLADFLPSRNGGTGFFGLIADESVGSLVIASAIDLDAMATREIFGLDNLRFVADADVIPVPGAAALFVPVLAAGWAARRKRA